MPLDNLARLAPGTSPSEINRLNRQRQVTIYAGLLPGVSQTGPMDLMTSDGGFAEHGAGLQHALRGPLARARPSRAELPDRVRAVADLHVSDPRGAVRVVAAPGDDPAVAAADAAVRAAVDYHHWTVAEHLLGARPAGAVRRREEELDPADRSREPAARPRHGARRGDPAGQPRPAAADPDDDVRVRGRHDPAGALERRRLGDQPRHRLRHHRRAVARAAAHARRHARWRTRCSTTRRRSGCGGGAGRRGRRRRRATLLALLLLPVRGVGAAGDDDAAAGRTGHRRRRSRCKLDPRRSGPDGDREQSRSGGGRGSSRASATRASRRRRRRSCRLFTSAVQRNSAADAAGEPVLGRSRHPDRLLVRRRRLRQRLPWGGAIYDVGFMSSARRRPTTRSRASRRR